MNPPSTTHRDRPTGVRLERRTGLFGLAMVSVIVANAGLSMALGALPDSWKGQARAEVARFASDRANLNRSLGFFAFSTLIFVFGLGFFAGLRRLADGYDPTGWTSGVVTIGAALFLAGGLLSETLHTGTAVALRSTPGYTVDANALLLLQSLWPIALGQAQVALGTLMVALSIAAWRASALPRWLIVLGIAAGGIDIVRPLAVSEVPVFIALFVPTFVWIAAISARLTRASERSHLVDARSTPLTAPADATPA